jgi:hypothetical protein
MTNRMNEPNEPKIDPNQAAHDLGAMIPPDAVAHTRHSLFPPETPKNKTESETIMSTEKENTNDPKKLERELEKAGAELATGTEAEEHEEHDEHEVANRGDVRRQLKSLIEIVQALRELDKMHRKMMEKRLEAVEDQLVELRVDLKKNKGAEKK